MTGLLTPLRKGAVGPASRTPAGVASAAPMVCMADGRWVSVTRLGRLAHGLLTDEAAPAGAGPDGHTGG